MRSWYDLFLLAASSASIWFWSVPRFLACAAEAAVSSSSACLKASVALTYEFTRSSLARLYWRVRRAASTMVSSQPLSCLSTSSRALALASTVTWLFAHLKLAIIDDLFSRSSLYSPAWVMRSRLPS